MLTLDTDQAALAKRGSIAPVVLVHFQTFSDYSLATVEQNYYWTAGVGRIRADWPAAATEFDPVIQNIAPIVRSMEHLPNAESVDTRRTVLDLVIGNVEMGGDSTLWEDLRSKNLPFGKIELAVLLVDPERRTDRTSSDWYDLTDHAGTEQTILFRGELTTVGSVTTGGIPLTFTSIEPELDWPVADVTGEVAPKDLGKRYPICVGQAKNVACINRNSGYISTLAASLTAAYTGNVDVLDTDGFPPSGSFEIQIGPERMTAEVVDADTIDITARGQSSTTAITHGSGQPIIEVVTDTVIVANGVQSDAFVRLLAINPFTDLPMVVDAARYTATLNDTTTDSGRTLTTLAMTQAQLRSLYDDFIADATAVGTQPEFEGSGNDTVRAYFTTYSLRNSNNYLDPDGVFGVGDADGSNWVSTREEDSSNRFEPTATEGDEDGVSYWIPVGTAPSPSRTVSRFRIVGIFNYEGAGGTDPNDDFRIFMSYDFFGVNGNVEFTVDSATPTTWNASIAGSWETVGGSPNTTGAERSSVPTADSDQDFLSFFLDTNWSVFTSGSNDFARFIGDQSFIEFELDPESLTRTTDVAVTGPAGIGSLVSFIADVDGAEISAALVEKPSEVIKWVIQEWAGLGTAGWDSTTFTAAATDQANAIAGDLRLAGNTFPEVLAWLGFEGRINVAAREGSTVTEYLALTPNSNYTFDASVRTLDQTRDETETRKFALELATRFHGLYKVRPWEGVDIASFKEVVNIADGDNDLTPTLDSELSDAEDERGQRNAEPTFFRFAQAAAIAEDVLGWYAHEALRQSARFGCTVPWGEGFDLELGDIVTFQPAWASAGIKCRVVQTALQIADARVGLNLEEVE